MVNGLKAENSNIKQKLCKRYWKWETSADPLLVPLNAHIRHLEKHFGVLYELWVDSSVFLRPRPPTFTIAECYASYQNCEIGVLAELYEFLPSEFHEMLEKQPKFWHEVRLPFQSCTILTIFSSVHWRPESMFHTCQQSQGQSLYCHIPEVRGHSI